MRDVSSELTHGDIGAQVVELAHGLGVPLTPLTFNVFYAHLERRVPELTALLNDFIGADKVLTKTIFEKLEDKYLTTAKDATDLEDLGNSIRIELEAVVEELAFAEEKTQEYGSRLQENSNKIADGNAEEAITNLMSATTDMSAHTQKLGKKIAQTNAEVSSLRTKLETMRYEAMTDPMTLLANRKAFDIDLAMAAKQAEKSEGDLVVIVGDLDMFSSFNDQWGSQMGDMILKLVGEAMRKFMTGAVKASRFGGEEFSILAPHMTLGEGERLAERIREWIAGKKVIRKSTGEEIGNVTMSFGVAALAKGESVSGLLERTERCMLAAKNDGRNCTKTQDSLAPPPIAT
jgi:diguanylate cyclase